MLSKVNFVNHGSVAVLNSEDAVKFEHDDAREGRGLKDHGVRNTARNGVDVFERPLVNIPNLTFQHGHIGFGRGVVKINDEGQGVRFVQKQRMVVEFFNHIANPVLVPVHRGVHPPTDVFGGGWRSDGHGRGEQRGGHQQQAKHTEQRPLHLISPSLATQWRDFNSLEGGHAHFGVEAKTPAIGVFTGQRLSLGTRCYT